jgi:hypothetical protein
MAKSRLPRAHLLDPKEIDKAIKAGLRCTLNDGGEVAGCALEIQVRKNGAAHGYFRYNGTPFGETGKTGKSHIQRIPLGPYDQGLPHLWSQRAACEQLIREGKSPKLHYGRIEEEQRASSRTVRQAVEDFFAWAGGTTERAPALWHSPETRKVNRGYKRRFLDRPSPLLDMPVALVRPPHVDEFLKPFWGRRFGKNGAKNKLGADGIRLRSLLHSTFEQETAHERYLRPNPASWKMKSPLSIMLGPVPSSTPHPAALYTDIPRIFAHLSQVRKIVAGYLTVEEAGYAFDRAAGGIRAHIDRHGFPNMVMRQHHTWRKLCWFIPISELKAKYGEFRREPIAIERTDVVTNSEMLRAVISTAVRPHMICEMYWDQIKWNEGSVPYIEYRPAENGKPSEHKNGWKYNFPYLVILTPGLRAIIETQRQQQIRDSVKIVGEGRIFQHARTHYGIDHWFGHPIGHRTLSDYLRRVVKDLDIKKPDMTPSGMRTTFGTWAKEQYECPNDERNLDELIDMTWGHVIPAIRNNPTNHHYLYNVRRLNHRWQLMMAWEKFCLSLCPTETIDPAPGNKT